MRRASCLWPNELVVVNELLMVSELVVVSELARAGLRSSPSNAWGRFAPQREQARSPQVQAQPNRTAARATISPRVVRDSLVRFLASSSTCAGAVSG